MTVIARRICAFLCATPNTNPSGAIRIKRAGGEPAFLLFTKISISDTLTDMVEIKSKHLDIAAIADSGQTFRFNRTGEGIYELRARDRCVHISQESAAAPAYLDCPQKEYDSFWKDYLDLDTDYGRFLAAIPEDDDFLVAAGRTAGGIRILRQDPWEMLISFIISQRKNIPAIKSCIEKLCERFGTEGAFPGIEQLAGASREELAECSLGYRTDYVLEAARSAAEGRLDLYAMTGLADEELRRRLMDIKGVGIKVANCVMLFGYHRIAAFPVDVWIARIVKEHYAGTFPLERYEGFAGVIQQYMFYYERTVSR
jgi:N-glycosylase/DNA lyase